MFVDIRLKYIPILVPNFSLFKLLSGLCENGLLRNLGGGKLVDERSKGMRIKKGRETRVYTTSRSAKANLQSETN